jgi:hypothetical protein
MQAHKGGLSQKSVCWGWREEEDSLPVTVPFTPRIVCFVLLSYHTTG